MGNNSLLCSCCYSCSELTMLMPSSKILVYLEFFSQRKDVDERKADVSVVQRTVHFLAVIVTLQKSMPGTFIHPCCPCYEGGGFSDTRCHRNLISLVDVAMKLDVLYKVFTLDSNRAFIGILDQYRLNRTS